MSGFFGVERIYVPDYEPETEQRGYLGKTTIYY